MKRTLVVALSTAVAAAVAAPAFADHQIGGYFRTQFIMEQLTADGQAKDVQPTTGVDMRFRARWQNNINEFVNIVWFGEVDTPWGEQSKGAIGGGGMKSADGVNIETKHAYLDVKVPKTPLSARIGLQGFGGTFDSAVMNDDMAGLKLDAKLGAVGTVTAFWAKYAEGNRIDEDDQNLYAAQLALAPAPGLKLNVDGYWLNSDARWTTTTTSVTTVNFPVVDANSDGKADTTTVATTTKAVAQDGGDLYWLGVKGGYKVGPVDLLAWYVYNFGENKTKNYDVSAHAASVKGSFALAGAKADVRLLWYGKDDDTKDDNSFNQADSASLNGSGSGSFEFHDAGLTIFLTDIDYNNFGGGRRAITDAAYAGYGLFGAVVTGSYSPPAMKDVYVKGALGMFTALDDTTDKNAATKREGKTLGTELSVKVGYKIAEKVDVSLRGSYAFLGDFYDKKAAGATDPDDLYKVIAMVNVPY